MFRKQTLDNLPLDRMPLIHLGAQGRRGGCGGQGRARALPWAAPRADRVDPCNRHWSDPPSCYWLRAHSRGLLVEGSVFNSGVGGGRKEEAVRWVMGCRGLLLRLRDAWS